MRRQLPGRVAAMAALLSLALAASFATNITSQVNMGGPRTVTPLRSLPPLYAATGPPPFPTLLNTMREASQAPELSAYTITVVVPADPPPHSPSSGVPASTVYYPNRPTATVLVPTDAPRVMTRPVPVDGVVGRVNVPMDGTVGRVDVPHVVVIYPGGIAAFPGLVPGSGFFRVIVDEPLRTYRVERCAVEYANQVLVEERPGVYRALGCEAAECRQMLLVERGLIHIAPCYGDHCRRKIVCQAHTCRPAVCRHDCHQIQLCEPQGCRTVVRPAFAIGAAPVEDERAVGLPLGKQQVPSPSPAPDGRTVYRAVVGLIQAAMDTPAQTIPTLDHDSVPGQHHPPLKPGRGGDRPDRLDHGLAGDDNIPAAGAPTRTLPTLDHDSVPTLDHDSVPGQHHPPLKPGRGGDRPDRLDHDLAGDDNIPAAGVPTRTLLLEPVASEVNDFSPDAPNRPERDASGGSRGTGPAAVAISGGGSGPPAAALHGLAAAVGLALFL